MADKQVSVKVPGADPTKEEFVPVTISPGIMARDVLVKLGKKPGEWVLSVGGEGGRTFGQNDAVYAHVEDGGKLVLTPKMVEGFNPSALFSALVGTGKPATTSKDRLSISGEPIKVTPTAEALWVERDWIKTAPNVYEGRYVTRYCSRPGRIVMGRSVARQVMLKDPPTELHAHPHWPCFTHRGDGWYDLHFTEYNWPRDVDTAIVNMERIVCEAFGRR